MEPKIEQPKQYTPEEIAQLEKSRTISDAELLKGGAEYAVNEGGEKENLLVDNHLVDDLKEMEGRRNLTEAQQKERVEGLFDGVKKEISERVKFQRSIGRTSGPVDESSFMYCVMVQRESGRSERNYIRFPEFDTRTEPFSLRGRVVNNDRDPDNMTREHFVAYLRDISRVSRP